MEDLQPPGDADAFDTPRSPFEEGNEEAISQTKFPILNTVTLIHGISH